MINVLREISWKSILSGFGVSLGVGLLLGVSYAGLISWSTEQWLSSAEFVDTASAEKIATKGQAYMESARWVPGWLIVAFITHFIAGYVAAQYAKRLEVLHGATVGIIVGAAVFNIVYSPAIVLSAVLGAMLKKRRKYAGI